MVRRKTCVLWITAPVTYAGWAEESGIFMKSDADIIIRNARMTDVPMLTGLMRRAFEDAFASNTRPEDLRAHIAANFNEPRQAEELGNPQVLTRVAMAGDDPAGYAQMLPGHFPECVKAERPVQLLRFYLRRPYWGSGMGDKLMQHCLIELSQLNYTDVWLSTWEKNRRARRFYRKWGFRPIGTAPFIVGTDRQTDLIMSRPVGPTGI